MENKFIRVISPISLAVAILFDIAALYFAYYAIKITAQGISVLGIAFLLIEIFAIVLAVMFTREVLRHGIIFRKNEFELTSLDENNLFIYSDIEKVETHKDTKASLRKNFVERYSTIIIYLKDKSVVTIELGLTTMKKLKTIEKEINKRRADF